MLRAQGGRHHRPDRRGHRLAAAHGARRLRRGAEEEARADRHLREGRGRRAGLPHRRTEAGRSEPSRTAARPAAGRSRSRRRSRLRASPEQVRLRGARRHGGLITEIRASARRRRHRLARDARRPSRGRSASRSQVTAVRGRGGFQLRGESDRALPVAAGRSAGSLAGKRNERDGGRMADGVYKIVEVVGVSEQSWEEAGRNA